MRAGRDGPIFLEGKLREKRGQELLDFFSSSFSIFFYLNNEPIGTLTTKLKPNAFSLKETNIEIHEETFVFYRK